MQAFSDGVLFTGAGLSANMEHISKMALENAGAGLEKAIDEKGLRYTFYVLTQVALSSREDDWTARLAALGIELDVNASLIDLTTEVQNSIDNYVLDHGCSSDLTEMAQAAASEALAELIGRQSMSLFGTSRDQLQVAVRPLSTRSGFSQVGQTFFANFMNRFLNFYLSRVTAAQVGGHRLNHVGDLSEFNSLLRMHCMQSAVIVRDFCGDWYSKTQWQQGITLENTSGFMAVALRKLKSELLGQRNAI